MKFITGILFASVLIAESTAISAKGETALTILLSFAETNGAGPSAPLVQGPDGNFYSTTVAGGTNGYGTVFRITPWGSLTTLATFANTNGANPRAGLVRGLDGSFYGTAYSGGAGNSGTIFKVGEAGALTTLFPFGFTNGALPIAGLEMGRDGSFYGTTSIGGSNSAGTAFRYNTNGTLTTLVSLSSGSTNGDSPYAGLVLTADGSLYGSAYQGGTNGNGTVFRVTTNGIFSVVHSFTGTNDGANPYAGLVQATDGVLYGTTFFGGAAGFGSIYKLTTNGAFSTLFSFGNTNGANPQAALIQVADGTLYGTTVNGGLHTNQFGVGHGTIFQLTTNGGFSTLLSFNGTNGSHPLASLLLGTDGSLYGTTANGGDNGNGTVFRLDIGTPPQPVFQSVVQTGNAVNLVWSALVGQRYQIQTKSNLSQPDWSNFGSTIIATNITAAVSDDVGFDSQKFYRAVLLR